MFILFKVINAYITALVRRFNLEGDEKAFLIESFTMSKIWRGSYQILRKLDPSKYSLILGIINEHHHWTLTMSISMSAEDEDLSYCMQTNKLTNTNLVLRTFMRTKGCQVSRWSCETVSHPIQSDGTSCGVCVCKVCIQYSYYISFSMII
ncbi:sentrin-specific protease-like [Acipenser oxyrinchus oxyrinchus]|uniref:Sentrin-specific protease-like n=1 Tax=Acipenser oxyrinchus oxyrinchus TaxID=40147 RepID=A0AAD8G6R5_ACIOX|nr:sentrin-specific protease-like [Acipenser oxyrinchus oxyrinchus]